MGVWSLIRYFMPLIFFFWGGFLGGEKRQGKGGGELWGSWDGWTDG